MKRDNKLTLKKVTLRDLDQTALDAMAGGNIRFTLPCGSAKTMCYYCPTQVCLRERE